MLGAAVLAPGDRFRQPDILGAAMHELGNVILGATMLAPGDRQPVTFGAACNRTGLPLRAGSIKPGGFSGAPLHLNAH
eukprot:2713875-Amphidinium_carterae.1